MAMKPEGTVLRMVGETRVDAETKAEVIRLYEAGTKVADISSQTNVASSTIYWILDQAGIQRTRIARRPRRVSMASMTMSDSPFNEGEAPDTLVAYVTVVRAQLEQMRRALPPGVIPPDQQDAQQPLRGSGPYL